ncbi:hypothetical protein VPH35_013349 [Triticum aestivum]|uniref:Uncharacterized protein n=1 Tax=Aegilops tauschii subsp. strangulata TaxID=200361 RepID=A0A452XZ70_AEGTS
MIFLLLKNNSNISKQICDRRDMFQRLNVCAPFCTNLEATPFHSIHSYPQRLTVPRPFYTNVEATADICTDTTLETQADSEENAAETAPISPDNTTQPPVRHLASTVATAATWRDNLVRSGRGEGRGCCRQLPWCW